MRIGENGISKEQFNILVINKIVIRFSEQDNDRADSHQKATNKAAEISDTTNWEAPE